MTERHRVAHDAPPPWHPDLAGPDGPSGGAPTTQPVPAVADGWETSADAAAVVGDVVAVYTDVRAGVRGPTLVGHVASLIVDVAALAPLVPVWELLPAAVATPVTVGLGVVAVVGHLIAWYVGVEGAARHHEAAAAAAGAQARVVYRR